MMGTRVREIDVDLAIPLYRVSALSKPKLFGQELAEDELRRLRKGKRWEAEKNRVLEAVRRALKFDDYAFEEIHGSRAYSRAQLRDFLERLLELSEDPTSSR